MTARAVIAAKPQPLLAREWLTAWIWGPTPFRVLHPPGPPPGDATGPFSDHVLISFDAAFQGLDVTCHFDYGFDPACNLSVLIDTVEGYQLFAFETRAYSLRHAFGHLAQACRSGEISIPVAGLHPRARWSSKDRDCASLSLKAQRDIHPCTLL